MAPGNFPDYRAENGTLDAMAIYTRSDLQLGSGDRPEQLSGMRVTSGFFGLLGWEPVIGREFLPAEELEGQHRVVMLSHALWERRFQADRGIVGRQVELSSESFTVVGILPPSFEHVGGAYRSVRHGDAVDVWWPLTVGPDPWPRNQHYTNAIGRLRGDVTVAQAGSDLSAVAVFGFAAGASLLTGLLFGLAPLGQMLRRSTHVGMSGGSARAGAARSTTRTRRSLVAVEVALAFMLLIAAGLLMRSFARLVAVESGFQPAQVLTLEVALPSSRYPEPVDMQRFFADLIGRLRTLPGVVSAGVGSDLPWSGYDENTGFRVVGREFAPGQGPLARYHFADAGTSRRSGFPLRDDRSFEPSDDAEAPPVVLVNEMAARRYWNDADRAGDPIGARVNLWGRERTVIGIVGDVTDRPDELEAKPSVYFPHAQQAWPEMILTVRSQTPPETLTEQVRRTVLAVDPALPVWNVRTLEQVAGAAVDQPRFVLFLISVFAGTAFFLALVGVYGGHVAGRRSASRELALRMALGAWREQVMRLVLSSGALLSGFGLVLGVLGAIVVTRVFQSMLFGIEPTDPTTFTTVAVVLVVGILAAAYPAARRAMRVDPITTLRTE